MEAWAKVATNFHTHPKVRRAGRDGRDVFLFALLKNRELDADGVLPGQYLEPWYLADALQCTEDEARNGVKRCIVSSLLEETDDGYAIVGWDSEKWGRSKTSTERVRKYREKKKQEPDETPCNASPVSETQKHREEKRREEKRVTTSRSRKRSAEARHAAEQVISAFNKCFNRDLSADRWVDPIEKLIGKGYTEAQMRGVVWWADIEWGQDPDRCRSLSPKTLLKLQSPQGYRTFPEYLDLAGELWRARNDGKQPPWEESQ